MYKTNVTYISSYLRPSCLDVVLKMLQLTQIACEVSSIKKFITYAGERVVLGEWANVGEIKRRWSVPQRVLMIALEKAP